MKILFPTDFSSHANFSLRYAIDLTNKLKAELHVLYVHPNFLDDRAHLKIEDISLAHAENELSGLITGIVPLLSHNNIPQFTLLQGNVDAVILKYIKEETIDLVVMGTQGRSKAQNFIFGSTTKIIAANSSVPVLAVPRCKYLKLDNKKILLALDNHEIKNSKTFECLNQIAKAFYMSYELLHIISKKENDFPFDPYALSYLKEPIGKIKILKNINIINGINDYIKKDDKIAIVTVIKRKKGFLKSLLNMSISSKEIYNTSLPLLILNE